MWVYLDDGFPEHPKIVRAGGDAAWMFVCGLAWCRRHQTGGGIPAGVVAMLSDRKKPLELAKKLVEVGLWEKNGDAEFQVHDYDEWNGGEAAERERKAEISEKRRRAAQSRWGRSKGQDVQSGTDANTYAHADANGMQSVSTGDANAYASAMHPDALTRADARPAPSPTKHPPREAQVGGPAFAAAGADVLEATWAVLARADLAAAKARGQAVSSTAGWLKATRERLAGELGAEARRLLGAHPDVDAEHLARLLTEGDGGRAEAERRIAATEARRLPTGDELDAMPQPDRRPAPSLAAALAAEADDARY